LGDYTISKAILIMPNKERKGGVNVYRCRVCGEVYIGEAKPKSCPFCGAHEAYFVLAA